MPSVRPQNVSIAAAENQKDVFGMLPKPYQQMIMEHPLVKEHGFAPHALAQGILWDQKRYGGMDAAFQHFIQGSQGMSGEPIPSVRTARPSEATNVGGKLRN